MLAGENLRVLQQLIQEGAKGIDRDRRQHVHVFFHEEQDRFDLLVLDSPEHTLARPQGLAPFLQGLIASEIVKDVAPEAFRTSGIGGIEPAEVPFQGQAIFRIAAKEQPGDIQNVVVVELRQLSTKDAGVLGLLRAKSSKKVG